MAAKVFQSLFCLPLLPHLALPAMARMWFASWVVAALVASSLSPSSARPTPDTALRGNRLLLVLPQESAYASIITDLKCRLMSAAPPPASDVPFLHAVLTPAREAARHGRAPVGAGGGLSRGVLPDDQDVALARLSPLRVWRAAVRRRLLR